MSVDYQEKVQGFAELVRDRGYDVDPVAVADAIIRRMVWDDTPDVLQLTDEAPQTRQPARLRGLVRVRRLVTPSPLTPRTALRA